MKKLFVVFLFFAMFFFAPIAEADGWLSGYYNRIKIPIDAAKIDAALSDFPVPIKLTSANFDFAKANSDGFDFRFTAADGTTLLKYERERHDSTNKLAEYWVKVPSVSDSADTYIYLYYRTEDTADGADPENVWDSNHKAVYHMKDVTTSTILDSTSNNNDGTKKGANEPQEVAGKIYKGQDFDGTNDYINAPTLNLDPTKAYTLEGWFKTSNSNDMTIVGEGDDTTNTTEFGLSLGIGLNTYNRKLALGTESWATNWQIIESLGTVNDDTWHYATGIYNNGSMILYLDGAQASTGTDNYRNNKITGNQYIGIGNFTRNNGTNRLFDGLIDEVRISNVARSAAWIKASYHAGAGSLLKSFINETITGNFLMFF
jgi:hypothetical protein